MWRLIGILLISNIIQIFSFYYVKSTATTRSTRMHGTNQANLFARDSYDARLIQSYFDKRPLEVWERLVDIGSPILGWYITRAWDNATSWLRSPAENEERLNRRAEDLKDAIVQGRSICLIKSGQAAALRQDLVKSPEYIRELSKLQDEVGTFSNDEAFKIMEEELGQDPHDIYDFDPIVPIASASIGQVYHARLKDSGREVAVKVQRPDARVTVPLDMYIIRKVAGYVRKKKKLRSDLEAIADEFGCQLYNEINYRQEMANCERFRALYGDVPNICVPRVSRNLTTRRVLTMQWIDGEKGPWRDDGEKLLTVGLQCSVLQLLDSGFFHGDPHRGNLLRTPDAKLAFLDFGMMSEVSDTNRYALIGTVLGLVNKDLTLVIENLKVLEILPDETETDTVVTALYDALDRSTDVPGSGSSLNFTRLNQNLEGISYLLPFRLPPFYTLIIRSLTILEGLALDVDPSFKLIKGAYPFIAKQVVGNPHPSPELVKLIRQVVLTPEGRIRWNKVENFVSLSSAADRALDGDFQALQNAQERSDIRKRYGVGQPKEDEAPPEELTYELVDQVLTFLVSDRGTFLREPLLDEIVLTVESLGLTTQSLVSLATNGIVPHPADKPDRILVEQFLGLLNALTTGSSSSSSLSSSSSSSSLDGRLDTAALSSFASLVSHLATTFNGSEPRASPVVAKAGVLVRLLLERLSERAAKRISRTVVSEDNVRRIFGVLAPRAEERV